MEYLYKTAGQEWLINLLKDGKLKTINKDWISLSLVENSGGQDDYGKMTITFDKDMIMSEPNAYEVDYEDPEFFQMFPTITRHITGFNNEQEYYDNIGYADAEEANEDGELTWMQNISSYETEQEVVIDEIIYKDGLIINVEFNEEPEQELIDLLKSKNIKYTINTIEENKTMKYVKNLFKKPTINESLDDNLLVNLEDFVTIVDSCVVLHIDSAENRITKFDVIRMEAAKFDCEIIGVDEDKVFIGSKTPNNTKNVEDFKNHINDILP